MNDQHDYGCPYDLQAIFTRRRALGLIMTVAAGGLAGCDQLPFAARAETEVSAVGPDGKECVVHPRETEGPFPADGSNRAHGTLANVLRDSGIVREDVRNSLTTDGPRADGVPLHLTIELVAVGTSCRPLAGHAVYLWHCDADGRYSLYDLPDASYLRAVGVADMVGRVSFTTIVPGCYEGRFPHMHFEIYPALDKATDYRNRSLTSQLVVPAATCKEAYARHAAYRRSIDRLSRSSLERDGIFRDNTPKQLAAQTLRTKLEEDGSYRAAVTIGVKSTAG